LSEILKHALTRTEERKRDKERIAELEAAIRKETADHKPSVATGLPCKCFLCQVLLAKSQRFTEAERRAAVARVDRGEDIDWSPEPS
jgi:hypothetical protein